LKLNCKSIHIIIDMSPYWLAAVYSLVVLLAALAGGWVPMIVRLTHTRMQVALSFVAGVILGIGLLHLVPHGYMKLDNIDNTVRWALGGFLAMFFLERFFHFHHHEAPVQEAPRDIAIQPAIQQPAHDHTHHGHGHDHATVKNKLSWGGAFLGMALHSVVDGVALGAAIQVEAHEGHGVVLAGFGTFLAVALHKPFDSLTIGTLMAHSGRSRSWRHAINFLFSLFAPLGVLAFFLGFGPIERAHPEAIGYALCFAGGAFLCIATSDLLPEVQFHSHDRLKLSIALLLGVALAAAIVLVETSGHEHGEHHTSHSAMERQ
jgi:zinc and cadmium transporter